MFVSFFPQKPYEPKRVFHCLSRTMYCASLEERAIVTYFLLKKDLFFQKRKHSLMLIS